MPKTQHNWNYAEFEKLLTAVSALGKKWDQIQRQYFPYISVYGVRNMYYKQLREDPWFKEKCSYHKPVYVDYSQLLTYNCFTDSENLKSGGTNSINTNE